MVCDPTIQAVRLKPASGLLTGATLRLRYERGNRRPVVSEHRHAITGSRSRSSTNSIFAVRSPPTGSKNTEQ